MPPVVVNDEDLIEIAATTKHDQKYQIVIDGKTQIEGNNSTNVFISKSKDTLQLISVNIENKKIDHIRKAFNGYIK